MARSIIICLRLSLVVWEWVVCIAREAWTPAAGAPPPTLLVPAHDGLTVTSVSRGDILVDLRDGGGFALEHPPAL